MRAGLLAAGRRRPPPTARSAKPPAPPSRRCSSGAAGRARAVGRGLPPPLRRPTPARYRVGDRAQRAPRAVRGDARRRRAPRCASAPKPRCSTLRCHATARPTAFRRGAAELSNCPSGARGRRSGLADARGLRAGVRARDSSASAEVGVLPRLVHSRFGLHVVEVLAREAGHVPAFEAVRGAVAHGAAPAELRHARCASTCSCWPARRSVEGVDARQRRHAAGAVDAHEHRRASTTCCRPHASSAEPQQLLFVFAGAELPADADAEQRAQLRRRRRRRTRAADVRGQGRRRAGQLRRAVRRGGAGRPALGHRLHGRAVGPRRPAAIRAPTSTRRCSTWWIRSRPAGSTACCPSTATASRCTWPEPPAVPDELLQRLRRFHDHTFPAVAGQLRAAGQGWPASDDPVHRLLRFAPGALPAHRHRAGRAVPGAQRRRLRAAARHVGRLSRHGGGDRVRGAEPEGVAHRRLRPQPLRRHPRAVRRCAGAGHEPDRLARAGPRGGAAGAAVARGAAPHRAARGGAAAGAADGLPDGARARRGRRADAARLALRDRGRRGACLRRAQRQLRRRVERPSTAARGPTLPMSKAHRTDSPRQHIQARMWQRWPRRPCSTLGPRRPLLSTEAGDRK